MTPDAIRADIAAFADDEDSVLLDKGYIIFQRERQQYECRVFQPIPGQLDIEINGRRMPYYRFLAEELGRLSVVAQSIQQKRRDVVPFIDTQAVLYDSAGRRSGAGSALEILKKKTSERGLDETTLVFLTADAGEGKTAVLRRLAQHTAKAYSAGAVSSLLLHIDTQGRSFVRLEEAVARELGQLRVSGLFYSGVVRLIRRGLLTIAIDGFDELLAEIGSSEAYSGLGAFLRQLGGAGTIIAAARSAYFEAENYAAQTRLLSSLPDTQVSVEQIRLNKWTRKETVAFFSSYRDEAGVGIDNAQSLYDEIAALVGEDHVLLQRPFLVYTMAKMLASTPGAAREIIQDLGDSSLKVVPSVIRSFLRREVEEKWRDPNGTPYLTLEQHEKLLAAIADEMWSQLGKSLPTELVQLVTETVIDDLNIPLPRRVQIVERVKAHVLLPAGAAGRPDHRAFDHDEFLNYFLAIRLVELLQRRDTGLLRRFLERYALPPITVKWTAVIEPWSSDRVRQVIAELSRMSKSEIRSTYLKQNAGSLAAKLATGVTGLPNLELDSMYFEGDTWVKTQLTAATFLRCVFNGVDFSGCVWRDCRFVECDVPGVTVNEDTQFPGCSFDEKCRVVGLLQAQDLDAMRMFVPEDCEKVLIGCGAHFDRVEEPQLRFELRPVAHDVRTALNSFLRIFSRNTGATDNVIRMKLGTRMHIFEKVVLPALVRHEVVGATEYHGSGSQHRYELNFAVDAILAAEDAGAPGPPQLLALWEDLRR